MPLSNSQSFHMPRPSHPRFYCRINIRIVQIVQIVVTIFINVSYLTGTAVVRWLMCCKSRYRAGGAQRVPGS